jgi:hypothetical protein
MPRTAINPQTGERIRLNDRTRQWEPMTEDFDFSAREMVKNIPGSAKQFGQDIVQPFIHPVQTAKAVKELISSKDPVIREAIKARYGSVDAFQRTLQEDPVGVLGDVSGLAMAGGGVLGRAPGVAGRVGRGVSAVGRTVDPLNIAAQGAMKTAARVPGIQRAATGVFESATKMPTSIGGSPRQAFRRSQQNIKTALKERVPPTQKGVKTVQKRIDNLNTQIDDIINTSTTAGTQLDVAPVFHEINRVIDEFDIPGNPNRARNVEILTKVRDNFFDSLDGRTTLTPIEMQRVKKQITGALDFNAKKPKARVKQFGEKTIARGLRKQIGTIDPRIDVLNAREGSLLDLADPLSRAAKRIGNRSGIGLEVPLMGTLGAMGGGAFGAGGTIGGGAFGVVAGLSQAPRVQARTGIILQQLIDAGLSPGIAGQMAPLLTAQTARQAGRTREE